MIKDISISEQAEDDELSDIAKTILGTWSGMEQENISLKQISEAIRSKGRGYTNIKTYPNACISDSKEIFNHCNLSVYTSGINLYWSANNGKLTGKIEWTSDMEQKLQTSAPSDFWTLIELLS